MVDNITRHFLYASSADNAGLSQDSHNWHCSDSQPGNGEIEDGKGIDRGLWPYRDEIHFEERMQRGIRIGSVDADDDDSKHWN